MLMAAASHPVFFCLRMKKGEKTVSEDQRFVELQEEEGLDIDAIFGSVPDTSANPPGSVAEPQPAQADETPAPAAESITAKSAPEKRSTDEEEPSLFSAFAEPKAEVPKDEKPEATQTQRSLFEKPPVFSYGSVREEIKDLSLTFEELRIQKADDFPVLLFYILVDSY